MASAQEPGLVRLVLRQPDGSAYEMKEGGKYELYVPSDLGYGPRGSQQIGPNETLIFDIELLEVLPSDSTQ